MPALVSILSLKFLNLYWGFFLEYSQRISVSHSCLKFVRHLYAKKFDGKFELFLYYTSAVTGRNCIEMSKLTLFIAYLIVFSEVANGYVPRSQVLTARTPFSTLRITWSGSILPQSTTSNHKVATESQLPSSVAQHLSTFSQFPIPDSSSQPSTVPYSSPLSQITASGSPSTYTYLSSSMISTASTASILSVLRS
jgi:hypothetical protein